MHILPPYLNVIIAYINFFSYKNMLKLVLGEIMKKGFLNVLLYLLFPGIFISMFHNIMNSSFMYSLFTILPYMILCVYYIIIYKKDFIYYLKNFKLKYIKWILIIWIIGFILMMLSNYIINYKILPNNISGNEELNRTLLFNHKFTYTLLLSIIIPFLEEISFRLEFKKNIKNKYVFLILTSLLFASMHLFTTTKVIELIYVIPYIILGFTFSFIYYKTDNVFSSIIAHIIHNTLIVIMLLV